MHAWMLLMASCGMGAAQASAERAAGQLIVSFENTGPMPAWRSGTAAQALGRDVVLWRFDETHVSIDDERQRLLHTPGVRSVEFNTRLHLQDAAQAVWAQRDLRASQSYLAALGGLLQRPGGSAIVPRPRVGILDTGIDVGHPDLLGNVGLGVNLLYDPHCTVGCPADVIEARELDLNGHGTAVAGIIGARHNDIGIDGLNDTVELLGIKAFDADGVGYVADVVRGIAWARTHGVSILNVSFGTPVFSQALADAIEAAVHDNLVVVAAAGNQGSADVLYPARLPNVVSVGSHDPGGISAYSNFGSRVSVYAPGDTLMTTRAAALGPNIYAPLSGTSAAAAYVTGLLSQVVADGRRGSAARALLLAHTVSLKRRGQVFSAVNAPRLLAHLRNTALRQTTLTAWSAPAYSRPGDGARVNFTLTNTGNSTLPRTPLALLLQRNDAVVHLQIGSVGPLVPGKSVSRSTRVALPTAWESALKNTHRQDIVVRLADDEAWLGGAAVAHTVFTDQNELHAHVDRLWLDPFDLRQTTHVVVQLRNDGNMAWLPQRLEARLVNAVHEGVLEAPQQPLVEAVAVPRLDPGESVTLRLPLLLPLDANAVTGDFSLLATLTGAQSPPQTAQQSFEMGPDNSLMPQYSGEAHMGSVAAAVDMLLLGGQNIADVHAPANVYRGSPQTARDVGGAADLGNTQRGWDWTQDWPLYPAQSKTLLDGAQAADSIDVAFGDYGTGVWNTHFWVVDEGDHAGLATHSALDKILAIMLGGYGSSISDGAIAAYNNGDKTRAWWLMGHAAHLLGDLSTGAHTLNRNWHGVVGDAYHDWLGHHGRFLGWTASQALDDGGFIDPYRKDLATNAERLRFLAYSTAQVGSAFPWRRTRAYMPSKGPRQGEGDIVLGGDAPHYEDFMQPLLANLPQHPRAVRDVGLDETQDAIGMCGETPGVGRGSVRADCWDGGDGHVCINNTTTAGNDSDGDLSRIADASYVYALRSIAGLIYLFAVETGQL